MTLLELAAEKLSFYRRPGWASDQYVHARTVLQSHDTREIFMLDTCWCHAPPGADRATAVDDHWESASTPEREATVTVELAASYPLGVPPWQQAGPMEA